VLKVALGDDTAVFTDPDAAYTVPLGAATLASMIVSDPPKPEELTNAIGIFMDHIEDVTREVPGSAFADAIELHGPGLQALVDTFEGSAVALPFSVDRDGAEEIYRTLATESAAQRRLNPGLPAHEVHHILGVACAVVATLRALQAHELTVVAGA
jgi:exopolyphosphatase/pppGpp-phosphohydrolase